MRATAATKSKHSEFEMAESGERPVGKQKEYDI